MGKRKKLNMGRIRQMASLDQHKKMLGKKGLKIVGGKTEIESKSPDEFAPGPVEAVSGREERRRRRPTTANTMIGDTLG